MKVAIITPQDKKIEFEADGYEISQGKFDKEDIVVLFYKKEENIDNDETGINNVNTYSPEDIISHNKEIVTPYKNPSSIFVKATEATTDYYYKQVNDINIINKESTLINLPSTYDTMEKFSKINNSPKPSNKGILHQVPESVKISELPQQDLLNTLRIQMKVKKINSIPDTKLYFTTSILTMSFNTLVDGDIALMKSINDLVNKESELVSEFVIVEEPVIHFTDMNTFYIKEVVKVCEPT